MTRFAVLSDVHANLHALRAVLDVFDRQGIDRFLCLGDLVGYGPYPNECVETVASLDPLCVAGNHDLWVLDRLAAPRGTALAQGSTIWTRQRLTDASREYLGSLPVTAELDHLQLAHGSPDDVQEYVRTEGRAQELLARRPGGGVDSGATEILLLGHTHVQWAYSGASGTMLRGQPSTVRLAPQVPHLLNPGSVGQSRDRWDEARCMVLDTEDRTATFHSVSYDSDACSEALRRFGRPPDSCRPARGRRGRVAAILRNLSGRSAR